MAIPLTGSGGLFTILGKLAKVLRGAHQYAGGNLSTYMADAISALGTNSDLIAPLPAALAQAQANASFIGASVRQVAQATLLSFVNADAPQADRYSIPLAMAELIRQMKAASASVPACAVGITPSAVTGNSGTGVVVGAVFRPDGLTAQNQFAETGELVCRTDSQGGGAASGSESWLYSGDYAVPDTLSYLWPGFSGGQSGLTTVNSQTTGSNLLRNSSFETYTVSNVPDFWTMTGTPGTHFGSESSIVYRGTKALKFIGDGATNTEALQAVTTLRPNRVYAANLWLRLSAAASVGNLRFDMLGDGSPLTDDAGGTHASLIDLSALAAPTVYTPFSIVFVTPRVLPAVIQIRLRLTAPLQSGKNLLLDALALTEMTTLYAGGPSLAAFAGATPFAAGDRYTVAATNDRNSATYGSTWQTVFDRFFNMRQLNMVLPYSGSPTIADSLITA